MTLIDKLVPLGKGAATYVPFLYDLMRTRHAGSTASAEYCYRVWAKHLCLLNETVPVGVPQVVVELGPGDAIGVGAAALFSGARTYIGVDVFPFLDAQASVSVARKLLLLFRQRHPIDVEGWPDFSNQLGPDKFPSVLSSISTGLDEERCAGIIDAIGRLPAPDPQERVAYRAPWEDASIVKPASADLIVSHSVLEHIADVKGVMERAYAWLRPGGLMSHQFDLQSHGITPAWDGHRSFGDLAWTVTVGKRPTLINRLPFSTIIEVVRKAGFKVLRADRLRMSPTIPREALGKAWRAASDEDLNTAGGYVVAMKP